MELKEDFFKTLREEAKTAALELIAIAKPEPGSIFVVGCSSSEVLGEHIGHGSSKETAQAIFSGIYTVLNENGLFLASQCCEHLNRAIIIEKEVALSHNLDIVSVVPQVHAGGSFATISYETFSEAVVVEDVKADLGIDIGDTFIGMHLKSVAVPVRLSLNSVGKAHLTCAKTRFKYIGGSRAMYSAE